MRSNSRRRTTNHSSARRHARGGSRSRIGRARACRLAPRRSMVSTLDHVPPGLAAEGAGVHGQRAAERARDAGEEFRGTQAPLHALARDARAGDARPRRRSGWRSSALEARRARRASTITAPRMPPSRTRRLLPRPSHSHRHVRRQLAQKAARSLRSRGCEEQVGGPAGVPGGVRRHGLVAQHARREFRRDGTVLGARRASCRRSSRLRQLVRHARRCCPAPMVSTTSPSRSTPRSASASSSTRLDEHRLDPARARARRGRSRGRRRRRSAPRRPHRPRSRSSTSHAREHLAEVIEQIARAGVAVRLEREHAGAARPSLAHGLERRRHLGRVVAVVIDDAARCRRGQRTSPSCCKRRSMPWKSASARWIAASATPSSVADRDGRQRIRTLCRPGRLTVTLERARVPARSTRSAICRPCALDVDRAHVGGRVEAVGHDRAGRSRGRMLRTCASSRHSTASP